jgi:hypothetical protein
VRVVAGNDVGSGVISKSSADQRLLNGDGCSMISRQTLMETSACRLRGTYSLACVSLLGSGTAVSFAAYTNTT